MAACVGATLLMTAHAQVFGKPRASAPGRLGDASLYGPTNDDGQPGGTRLRHAGRARHAPMRAAGAPRLPCHAVRPSFAGRQMDGSSSASRTPRATSQRVGVGLRTIERKRPEEWRYFVRETVSLYVRPEGPRGGGGARAADSASQMARRVSPNPAPRPRGWALVALHHHDEEEEDVDDDDEEEYEEEDDDGGGGGGVA
eukprot:scaffold689_cov375-Prasinococcus_capsulatus_cf.AAC.5